MRVAICVYIYATNLHRPITVNSPTCLSPQTNGPSRRRGQPSVTRLERSGRSLKVPPHRRHRNSACNHFQPESPVAAVTATAAGACPFVSTPVRRSTSRSGFFFYKSVGPIWQVSNRQRGTRVRYEGRARRGLVRCRPSSLDGLRLGRRRPLCECCGFIRSGPGSLFVEYGGILICLSALVKFDPK